MSRAGRQPTAGYSARGTESRAKHTARGRRGPKEEFATMSPFITRIATRLHGEAGQGTVEYVGIVLAVAALLVAVAAAIDNKVGGPIATALVRRLQEAVAQVGNAKHG